MKASTTAYQDLLDSLIEGGKSLDIGAWKEILLLRFLRAVVDHMQELNHISAFDFENERDLAFARYGRRVATKLLKVLVKRQVGCDFVDNVRFARVDRQWEVMEYVMKRKNGCCGYHDSEVRIGFHRYLLGFNYGH